MIPDSRNPPKNPGFIPALDFASLENDWGMATFDRVFDKSMASLDNFLTERSSGLGRLCETDLELPLVA